MNHVDTVALLNLVDSRRRDDPTGDTPPQKFRSEFLENNIRTISIDPRRRLTGRPRGSEGIGQALCQRAEYVRLSDVATDAGID